MRITLTLSKGVLRITISANKKAAPACPKSGKAIIANKAR